MKERKQKGGGPGTGYIELRSRGLRPGMIVLDAISFDNQGERFRGETPTGQEWSGKPSMGVNRSGLFQDEV